MPWNPSDQYKKVAEANRQSYERHASLYDKTETCNVSPRLQAMLRRDLDNILQMTPGYPEKEVHVLDACGGSGNVALKLIARGSHVTLCDISPELIQLFESKCKRRGFSNYEAVCQEIGSFLSLTDLTFDLIVFSSALHHIEDYTSVLNMAATRLNDSGLIYTVFDPVKWKFLAYEIIWLDWLLFAILNMPNELFSAIRRKLNKMLKRVKARQVSKSPENKKVTVLDLDALTEYHVRSGIDDFALVGAMEKTGLMVIWHIRYTDARYTFFRLFLSILRRPTSFKLLLRK